MFTKTKTQKQGLDLDRHFVFVEAPIEIVGPAAAWWGESTWWPKKCSMHFIRTSPGELGLGATYDMNLQGIFPQTWKVEVTKFEPGRLVERTFRQGFFKGHEIIRAEERANGTRIEYEMHYAIPNPINNILWNIILHKMHDVNIVRILDALKEYCLKQVEQSI